MNIAILSFYSGIVDRGVEVWVKELTGRLTGEHKVNIYQAGKSSNSFEKQVELKVDWNSKDNSNNLSRKFFIDYWSKKILEFTKKALLEIDKNNINLIIPTNGGWQSVLCSFYAKRNNKKLIIVGHSGMGWDDRVNLLSGPDVFVALTQIQKKWATNNGFGVKVVKIPDGVDTEKFSPEGEKIKYNLPRPIFLTATALTSWKRPDLVIKAVSKLNNGSLVILGKGDSKQTEFINMLGKKLLDKRFLLTSTSYENIQKWYRGCDIFTLASWEREAFGMVIIEAMACNKPVVVNDDPIRREIVGDGGLFCDPANINNYSQMLVRASETKFADKPKIQAKRFDWSNIVVQYNELFKSI